jgi:hypothetical protein
MPQPVKFSNSNVPNSIKKGEVAIGVNNVEYGPTPITDWWSGINPPVSGYTAYAKKAANGPSIMVAQNDNDLLGIARAFGASSSVTTTAGALNYFASQSDMIVVNKNYNNIVTSGLVLNLDASFVASYPVSGTSWYDISGSGNTGTLQNGPTFDSVGGSIVFDGSDDFILLNQTLTLTDQFTLNLFILPFSTSTKVLLGNNGGDYLQINNASALGLFSSNASTTLDGYSWDTSNSSMVTVTRSNTNVIQTYRNGVVSVSGNLTGDFRIKQIGQRGNSSRFYEGKIYACQIYDRALSSTEILQNYYGGPIVTSGLTFAVDAGNLVSFQNGAGSTFSLVGSYTGTLQNGVAYTTGGGGGWVFDGSDDRIDLQQNAILNSSSVTVCAWVNLNSDGTRHIVLANWGGYALEVNSNASVVMYTLSSGSQVGATTGTNAITWGKWSFIVGVYDNNLSQISTYVDGILQATRPSTTSIQYNVTVRSISATQFGGGAVNGQVTFVYQYNRALSASEVAQNFNAQRNRFGL